MQDHELLYLRHGKREKKKKREEEPISYLQEERGRSGLPAKKKVNCVDHSLSTRERGGEKKKAILSFPSFSFQKKKSAREEEGPGSPWSSSE